MAKLSNEEIIKRLLEFEDTPDKTVVPLKEDGSLDVEQINRLPLYEFTEVIGCLSGSQRKYYYSNMPILEGKQHTKAVKFFSYDEIIKKGGIDISDYLSKKIKELKERK